MGTGLSGFTDQRVAGHHHLSLSVSACRVPTLTPPIGTQRVRRLPCIETDRLGGVDRIGAAPLIASWGAGFPCRLVAARGLWVPSRSGSRADTGTSESFSWRMPRTSIMRHHRCMQDNRSARMQTLKPDAERDRFLQVLMLEYGTLRAEILTRLSARYQFVGFVTGAAALIGVAIGYSSGLKVWLLTAVSIAVLAVGFYGYCRMIVRGKLISARIAEIEDRINRLVPAEPGTPNLLSWESEHKSEPFISVLFDYRQLRLHMKSVKAPSDGSADSNP